MDEKQIAKRVRILREDIDEQGDRIRRYSIDPTLKEPDIAGAPDPQSKLRNQVQATWERWFALKVKLRAALRSPSEDNLDECESEADRLDREIDLVQRELISNRSYAEGGETVRWMLLVLLALVLLYLVSHGVSLLDFSTFESWPEWGPLKYGEVAFWSSFGALCALLFKATRYLARRDFDRWYKPWYIATFIRAPFQSIILMMIVLEFVEWYGEGTWIETHLLEEGSKFYLIVFMSFCLGLATDATAQIMRDLADGVSEFISRAVARVADKLSTAVSKDAM